MQMNASFPNTGFQSKFLSSCTLSFSDMRNIFNSSYSIVYKYDLHIIYTPTFVSNDALNMALSAIYCDKMKMQCDLLLFMGYFKIQHSKRNCILLHKQHSSSMAYCGVHHKILILNSLFILYAHGLLHSSYVMAISETDKRCCKSNSPFGW